MKILTLQELEALRPYFVSYLVSQGIDSEQWVKIKAHSPTQMEEIIENFSHHIYGTFLPKIQYLIAPDDTHFIHLGASVIQSLRSLEGNIVYEEFEYNIDKESTAFTFLEAGYRIENGEMWKNTALKCKA